MERRSLVETTGLIAAGLLLGTALAGLVRPDAPSANAHSEGAVVLGSEAMKAAVVKALRTPSRLERARALDRALEALNLENAAAVRDAMAASPGAIDRCEVGPFTDALAQIDPAVAFETSLGWKDPGLRKFGVHRTSYHWALRGGELAAEHAIKSVDGPDFAYLGHMGIARGLAERGDTQTADQLLARVPIERRGFLTASIASWLVTAVGHDALIAWAEGIPEDAPNGLKQEVTNTALLQLARYDIERAVAWFEGYPADAESPPALTFLLQSWAQSDPDAMLAWLRERPITPDAQAAFRSMVGNWKARDAEAARAWLLRQNREALARMGQGTKQ